MEGIVRVVFFFFFFTWSVVARALTVQSILLLDRTEECGLPVVSPS